jgi:hypothetical protein
MKCWGTTGALDWSYCCSPWGLDPCAMLSCAVVAMRPIVNGARVSNRPNRVGDRRCMVTPPMKEVIIGDLCPNS